MGWLLLLLLFVGAPAWAASVSCSDGVLGTAQTVEGASANTFHDAAKQAIGVQGHITAGTATASIQFCCRSVYGAAGCDTDAEWQNLGGCVQALDVAAVRNLPCAITPAISCLYRGFIATGTCIGCSVDFTYGCSID